MSAPLAPSLPGAQATGSRRDSAVKNNDEGTLLWALSIPVLLRAGISSHVLDIFEHYSSVGGSIAEKVHPGAILLLVAAGVVLAAREQARDRIALPLEKSARILIAALAAVAVIGIVSKRTEGFSYIIDSILVAPVMCLAMLRLSYQSRVRIFEVAIYAILIDDLVVFGEFLSHRHLYPYPFMERIWRPAGLMGHPLTCGLATAMAIPFVWIMERSTTWKLVITIFLVTAAFAAGARMASIFSVVAATAAIWVHLQRSAKGGAIDEGAVIVFGAAVIIVLSLIVTIIVSSGLAERIASQGLYGDDSSQSRLTIYKIFHYLSAKQIIFGVSRTWAEYVELNYLRLPRSESPIVDYIVEFGLVGTIIILPALLYFLWTLARGSQNPYVLFGVGTYLVVASTNNELSSKTPVLLLLTCMAVGAQSAIVLNRVRNARALGARRLAVLDAS